MNPIPLSSARPSTSHQLRPAASWARVNRCTTQVEPRTPAVLPTTRPRTTPTVTGSVRLTSAAPGPAIETPAAKNANTGTATPADIGRKRCSKCSASPGPGPWARRITGTVNPSSTPATVACTPDSWTSTQAATASGSSSHQDRTGG